MGLAALVGTFALGEGGDPILDIALTVYQTLGNYVLLAVPLYILVGTLMEQTGLNERLFDFARAWTGRLRGGLGVATVLACALFAAISGSSVATAATIGLVAFPALTRRGYDSGFAGALLAAGGTLGILIPPSIAMILYGVLTEQSIGALFVAGVVPGILLSGIMALYTMAARGVPRKTEEVGWPERLRATRSAIWVLLLPAGVLFSIYSGLATPTEVAAIAVLYVVAVGFGTRVLDGRKLVLATAQAVRTSVMIFMIVAFGRVLTEFFTVTGLPTMAVEAVQELSLTPLSVVALMVAVYIVLGTFLEATSMLLISVPILYPVAQSIEMDPLAFGVFVVLAIEAAQITPPVGINLYTLAAIGRVHLGRMSLHALPYVGMLIAMMFAVYLVPQLATWLPATMR
jgi:C4-dicarboxylate transporter DctM subunit